MKFSSLRNNFYTMLFNIIRIFVCPPVSFEVVVNWAEAEGSLRNSVVYLAIGQDVQILSRLKAKMGKGLVLLPSPKRTFFPKSRHLSWTVEEVSRRLELPTQPGQLLPSLQELALYVPILEPAMQTF